MPPLETLRGRHYSTYGVEVTVRWLARSRREVHVDPGSESFRALLVSLGAEGRE